MRVWILAGLGLLCGASASAQELPAAKTAHTYSTVGYASWYGKELQGHRTSDGERFDMRSISAANKSMPLPCYARVTNLRNGASMLVRVNDRGPYVRGRIVDLSERAADLLDVKHYGVAKVRVEYVAKAPPAGSDENFLLASLNSRDAPPDGVSAVGRMAFAADAKNTAPALYALASTVPAAKTEAVVAKAANAASPFGDLSHSPFIGSVVAAQ